MLCEYDDNSNNILSWIAYCCNSVYITLYIIFITIIARYDKLFKLFELYTYNCNNAPLSYYYYCYYYYTAVSEPPRV